MAWPVIAQNRIPSATIQSIRSETLATSGSPSLGITTVNLVVNSMAWDPVSQKIYLSLPSTDGAIGNAIQVLDPATGVLGANVFAGSEPTLPSISATSQYIYVGKTGPRVFSDSLCRILRQASV
jgi:DNA-binding beta-propeller fold protein YncE